MVKPNNQTLEQQASANTLDAPTKEHLKQAYTHTPTIDIHSYCDANHRTR